MKRGNQREGRTIRRPFLLPLAAAFVTLLSGCAGFLFGVPRFSEVSETPRAPGAYSRSTVYGGMLFSAGIFPSDLLTGKVMRGDIAAQTHRVLDSLEAILSGAGCTMNDVVEVNVYLLDYADLAGMNEVIAARLGGNRPLRTTVPVARLPGPALLEVDFVARVPQ